MRTTADQGCRLGAISGLLLIGYFEGLDAERAIAWRAADSFALREFLGLVLPEAPPDHSTISRTRRLIDLETHEAVFTWMLQRLADAGLVKGKTVGIDATTLEANAALRSIVRHDTGESYQDFLTKLAQASGIETPTRADLARVDRKRKKKGSNDDWTHPHDPDAKITKMKDGRTPMASKRSSPTRAITAINRSWISRPWACAAISPNPIGDDGIGRRTPTHATPCTAIDGAFAARAVNGCSGCAANGWNDRSRISMRPAVCAACTFEGTRTFGSDC